MAELRDGADSKKDLRSGKFIRLDLVDGKLKLPVTAEKRQRLADLVIDSGLVERAARDAAPPAEFSPVMCKWGFNLIGQIEAFTFAALLKVPPGLAIQVFSYTDQEIVELTPPTLALLHKHARKFADYAEEIAFLTTFAGITARKVALLKMAAAKQKADAAEQIPLRTNGMDHGTVTAAHTEEA